MPPHDVLADPLPPRIREKLEAAVKKFPGAPTAPRWSSAPTRYLDKIERFDRSKDDLLIKMWEAGIPSPAMASALGLGSKHAILSRRVSLRRRGLLSNVRERGWKPPRDWQERLDAILKEIEK